jgi:hypothetical protein
MPAAVFGPCSRKWTIVDFEPLVTHRRRNRGRLRSDWYQSRVVDLRERQVAFNFIDTSSWPLRPLKPPSLNLSKISTIPVDVFVQNVDREGWIVGIGPFQAFCLKYRQFNMRLIYRGFSALLTIVRVFGSSPHDRDISYD